MIKLKNEKGISLLVLTVAVVVLSILTSITIGSSTKHLGMKRVNSMYSDIEILNQKVMEYYLKTNNIPIYDTDVYANKAELKNLLKANNNDQIFNENSNDNNNYYVINLSLLENLTLNYGQEYRNWNNASMALENRRELYQDLYIINEQSHQIYYPKGIEYNDTVYFSKDITRNPVDRIIRADVGSECTITLGSVTKSVTSSNNTVLTANLSFALNDDYNKNTLQYAWDTQNNQGNNLVYTSFNANSNVATVASKPFTGSSERTYYLYIKILDKNGKEHIRVFPYTA